MAVSHEEWRELAVLLGENQEAVDTLQDRERLRGKLKDFLARLPKSASMRRILLEKFDIDLS